ncbi:MAG: DUF1203 domain-containing protein [Pseudomonadota bacterium]|jgi:Protein of unknown function (DUF1203).
MSFRIVGLDPQPFAHLFGLPDAELRARGVIRQIADSKPGFPDRIELRDVEPGESVLLLNFTHQPADNPYRASHAIFVREGAEERFDGIDDVPEALRVRVLSLRAFGADHMMIGADLADGRDVERTIERLFADPRVAYIHAHFAKRGCYAARIERAAPRR